MQPSRALELRPGEVALFGYGSLLWRPSFERTYGRPYTRQTEVAYLSGFRRVWDALLPNRTFYFRSGPGERCDPEHIVYLNVRPAKAAMNGLLYVITRQDLSGFDEREVTYDRFDVGPLIRGVTVTGGPVYVYASKPTYVAEEKWPRERAAIRQTYLDIVESGLEDLGPEFRTAYEASTDQAMPMNIITDERDEQPVR